MSGVILDPHTGRPESRTLVGRSGQPIRYEQSVEDGWRIRGVTDALDSGILSIPADIESRLPDNILLNLEKARLDARMPRSDRLVAAQQWRNPLYAINADGAQVLNTVSETIMVPDFSLLAGWILPGTMIKYTLFFNISTVITTPGTIILRLRYGGVGGTALAASGAFAPDPTAASTTVSGSVEWYTIFRSVGTAAPSFTMGRMFLNDFDDATVATIVGNLNMLVIPVSAPAAVNINTTTTNALSPTVQFSVATATTQLTSHIAVLESMM